MALPARDLTQLLSDLRRTKTLVTPHELAHRLPPVVPTGLSALDELLGGGLPQGRIVDLAENARGAAGTTLALHMLGSFTGTGRLAAVVDRSDAFDPRTAADAGVDLERTLWCRPTTAQDAIRAADVLLASGAFGLVLLDLGVARRSERGPVQLAKQEYDPCSGAPLPRRVLGKKREEEVSQGAWLRLSRDAENARASLVVLGGGGAGTFSAVSLRAVRAAARFLGEGPGRTFEGLEITVALERNKLGLDHRETVIACRAPELFPTGMRDPIPGQIRVTSMVRQPGDMVVRGRKS